MKLKFVNFFRPDIVIALAGNKSDLANRRAVEYEEANAYAEENSLLFMETSAKNANNVNEIFLAIARKLPKYGWFCSQIEFLVKFCQCLFAEMTEPADQMLQEVKGFARAIRAMGNPTKWRVAIVNKARSLIIIERTKFISSKTFEMIFMIFGRCVWNSQLQN